MNSTIGVYDNHDLAVEAVQKLKDQNFPMKQLSIIGKAETEVVDNEMHITPKNPIKMGGVATGTALGATLGVLTGVGMFAIPGLGFLFGAGALVGAIAGVDFGLIGGGLASVLTTVGVNHENAKKYESDLNAGHFLVVAHGNKEEVEHANAVLHEHGTHSDVTSH